MTDSVGVDGAAVQQWKTKLLDHLKRRPRDNIRLEGLRNDKALALAVMQLVKEQAPRLVLSDFGTSLTLSWRITLDALNPETLRTMKQEQLILDAEALDGLDELPAAPGEANAIPSATPSEGSK